MRSMIDVRDRPTSAPEPGSGALVAGAVRPFLGSERREDPLARQEAAVPSRELCASCPV